MRAPFLVPLLFTLTSPRGVKLLGSEGKIIGVLVSVFSSVFGIEIAGDSLFSISNLGIKLSPGLSLGKEMEGKFEGLCTNVYSTYATVNTPAAAKPIFHKATPHIVVVKKNSPVGSTYMTGLLLQYAYILYPSIPVPVER